MFHSSFLFILLSSIHVMTNHAFVILNFPTRSKNFDSMSSAFNLPTSSDSFRVSDSGSGNDSVRGQDFATILYSKSKDLDHEDDDEDDIDLSDRDWRAFRAQLVMESSSKTSNMDDEQEQVRKKEGETKKSTASSNNTIEYNDDLDGIGSIFAELPSSSSSSTTKTTSSTSSSKQQPMTTSNFTPLHPSQWAYDSGNVIEKGAVILGGVEQAFGFGLRQQYFHKAVILVIDHDEYRFTKGIILNRPSDLILVDDYDNDDDEVLQWRVWFGGDVQGLNAIMPEVVCLHSLCTSTGNKDIDEQINKVSTTVMKDIQWTTFEDAKKLVKKGLAKTTDFWVFAGYAGWGPGQLMGELERKSWYMCATDSQTLLKELAKQSALTDPRDAGLDTWELLMNLIGRGETVEESSGDFEDLMLKEWARENLLSFDAGGNGGMRMQSSIVAKTGKSDDEKTKNKNNNDYKNTSSLVGSLIRAAPSERSPFLLEKQEFHKSIVLIIGDESEISIGMILNQPSTKAIEMMLVDKVTAEKRTLKIPIRFGGQYSIQGQNPLMWFHNNQDLKDMMVGSPINKYNGIWRCSQEDASRAVESGKAKPSDFLITSGISVWLKGGQGNVGLKEEIAKGNFEIIPSSKYTNVWRKLLQQKEVLTKLNLVQNISKGHEAWEEAGESSLSSKSNREDVVTEGIGEGFDEDNDAFVHNSDVRVSKLSDDALRSWVATFLLGAPSLGA